jgi:hypothetical protein
LQDLLQLAIERHGGSALWRRLRSVVIEVHDLGGPLPVAKGLGRTFPQPRTVEIFAPTRRVEFKDYPVPGNTGAYDRGAVGIVDGASARDAAQLHQGYRSTFSGLRKLRRWSPLDGIYFFGYALSTYFSVPFILPQLDHEVRERSDGFVVRARFPPSFDTHNETQSFFFDATGLLLRHDYAAEVVGPAAWGAHFTSDYQNMENFMVARKRDVRYRLGSLVTPIPVLHARLEGSYVCWK